MTDKIDWLDWLHGLEPFFAHRERHNFESTHRFSILYEVVHQSAISHHQAVGFDAVFDPGQQTSHRGAVAVTDITNSLRVCTGLLKEHIHGAAQVNDQLDLFLPVLRG